MSTPPSTGTREATCYGVLEHLDWLTDLGVNAIYFNPIFQSASNHRYHTHDFFKIDPLLGGEEAFDELLRACHSRGIRVVLDGVFNHASRGFFQFNDLLESGSGLSVDRLVARRPLPAAGLQPRGTGRLRRLVGTPCPPQVQYREPGGARVLDAGGRVLD